MSGVLPASRSAQRAELEVRERGRAEAFDRIVAMERKLDAVITGSFSGQEVGYAPSPVQDLALAIGQDRIMLPPAVIVSRTLNDEGDEVATAIRVGHLTVTIAEAVRLGILDLDGRFSHYRAGTLLHAVPQPGAWVRPHQAAAAPGRPR